ncbi:MAG: alpha-galactosidase [Thermoguttaceae bacterium]
MITTLAWILVAAATGIGGDQPTNKAEAVVATADTEIRVEASDDSLRLRCLRSLPAGTDWTAGAAAPAPVPLIPSIEMAGRTLPVRWRFVDQHTEPKEHSTIFRFVCNRPALELRSIWQAHPGPGPVEHTIFITNREAQEILLPLQPTLEFSFAAAPGHTIEQWWVERGGSRPSDVGTHRDRVRPEMRGSLVSTPYGGGPIPWLSVQDVEGCRGWYAGIKFSGFVRMALQAGRAEAGEVCTVKTVLGLGKSDAEDISYRTRLAAGATFEAPTIFLGCYGGQVDDGANRLRRWVERHLRPPCKANLPLLVNNSWGNGMAIDEALMRGMIDSSARLGMEMVGVDAGWYRHVGDWRTDLGKFPSGLTTLADYAHSKGLLFGLWLAWTQGGDTYDAARPGKVLSPRDSAMRSWFPTDYPSSWRNSDFTGATVCLGEPNAVAWCLGDLRRAAEEFHVDMLEHDQVMIVEQCGRQEHRHTASPIDVAYHAAQGYYRVQDGLRKSFPKLLLEDCCNGGNLVDYGILRRTHYVSITDVYDPVSNRRAFYDSSYAIPAAMCECYVENRPGKTPANFIYMLRSGLMGWCTIMTDMTRWTPAQQAAAQREFNAYKKTLRPLIQQADLYHVSERPDGRRWDGIEYYDPQSGQGVLFAFRSTTPETQHRFPLKGLDPRARYHLVFADGSSPPAVMTGRELAEAGLLVSLTESESSELVYLSRD